jgi:hypothetical protein
MKLKLMIKRNNGNTIFMKLRANTKYQSFLCIKQLTFLHQETFKLSTTISMATRYQRNLDPNEAYQQDIGESVNQ